MTLGFASSLGSIPWGGSEELWCQAARAAHRMQVGVAVSVQHWPARPAPVTELERLGVAVHWRRPWRMIPHRFHHRLQRWQAARWLRKVQPDLVLLSEGGGYQNLPWMISCARSHIPFVNLVHAANEGWWPDDGHAANIRQAYLQAAEHCFVCETNRRLVETQIALRLDRARVVRNPYNVPYNVELSWPASDPLRLACVGRLSPSAKGQDLILDVLARPEWRARAVEVSLFGDGPNREQLESLVSLHGLRNVSFRGSVSDVTSIWRDHHALVLPSRFEGLPLVVVEAMLCARVCIVTPAGGNAELMTDGETGFVASAISASGFADAMERAWSARDCWPAIGRAAAESARRQVPADPAAEFAQLLIATAESLQPASFLR